jgi:hypothetical protein
VTSTAFITHRDCQLHDMGSYHPECPERLTAISDHMIAQGLDSYFAYHDAPLAEFAQLRRVHSAAHLERVKRASPELGIVHLDPDTAMNRHTWKAALRAAGAGVLAVDLVMAGAVQNAFCAVRPPGHHAERESGDGFLFLQQHRRRRGACTGSAQAVAGGGGRFRRAPWQRHRGLLQGRPARTDGQHLPASLLPLQRYREAGVEHAQRAAQPRYRRGRVPAGGQRVVDAASA